MAVGVAVGVAAAAAAAVAAVVVDETSLLLPLLLVVVIGHSFIHLLSARRGADKRRCSLVFLGTTLLWSMVMILMLQGWTPAHAQQEREEEEEISIVASSSSSV